MNIRAAALLVIAITAVNIGLPSAASGQGYVPPAGPTITPYLDYFNAPINPMLGNYYTYVRPRADLRANLNQLGGAVRQQDDRLNQLGNDPFRPGAAAPTGTGSTFLNYSHYYSGMPQGTTTPQRSAGRRGGRGLVVGLGTGSRGGFGGY